MKKEMEQIRPMQEKDGEEVLALVREFYSSTAVQHSITEEAMQATLAEALNKDQKSFNGYVFEKEGQIIGYAYVTIYFESEIGGSCVLLDDIFILPDYQGYGIGSRYLDMVLKQYLGAKRFRIELTPENTGARKLYKSKGYEALVYDQLYLDRP